MSKINLIDKPMGQQIMPITINQDGSMTATVSLGFITESDLDGLKQTIFNVQAQNSHYLTSDEAKAALQAICEEGETVGDALDRAVGDVLRAKGLIQS